MVKWRLRRVSSRLILAYLASVLVVFSVLFLPEREEAIPAFAEKRSTEGEPAFMTVLHLVPDWQKSCLRLSVPMLGVDESEPDDISLRALLARLLFGLGQLSPIELFVGTIPGTLPHLDVYEPGAYAGPVRSAEEPKALFSLGDEILPQAGRAGSPLVAIYHTHAMESFLTEMKGTVKDPDDAHSMDMSITVMRVGREIARTLQTRYAVGCLHSPEIHDSSGKLGAYTRSEYTMNKIVKEYPSVRLILDIHRDSQPRSHTTVEIGKRKMARVMVVLGTDNPRWKENYALAERFLDLLDGRYPGLSLGIYPKPGRFNQHYSPNALLLEVGGVENTLDEEMETAAAIADVAAMLVQQVGE
ncbi:MAG TPA: stage II sporulation protein P [Firmicutes bacterium]|nr:stage II sporulation protein P [Bacillota bacterium]